MHTLVNGHSVPRPGPSFEIVRLKAGMALDGFICSDQLWGYMTHWIVRGRKGFSVECTKGKKTCRCESDELPTRWKGYFHCWDVRRSREVFLEITPFVADELLKNVQGRESFRGLKFKATRGRGADNSRLNLTIYPYQTSENLPASKDPRPYLEALWALVGQGLQDGEVAE